MQLRCIYIWHGIILSVCVCVCGIRKECLQTACLGVNNVILVEEFHQYCRLQIVSGVWDRTEWYRPTQLAACTSKDYNKSMALKPCVTLCHIMCHVQYRDVSAQQYQFYDDVCTCVDLRISTNVNVYNYIELENSYKCKLVKQRLTCNMHV